ncbi:unnamed protein product [Dimorphilus gyrociliatus]|uniref:BZIP domain-containing protein n=1 Tax=Dimorphilus gyrociliatus TaxID=2664684 RepID=A0A7I8VNG0_9ANNE|nr:unnamed protein product [Dimorphilus gyrociliatus]
MAPMKKAAAGLASPDKESNEYKMKRERNNIAVRKSRMKSRMKQKETNLRVEELKKENEELEERIKLLSKELGVLKDLFLAYAGNNVSAVDEAKNIVRNDHEYSAPVKR